MLPLEACVNLEDVRGAAKYFMSKQTWDYYESGAETESTLNENVLGFRRIFLRPRVLVAASGTSTACTLLGQRCAFPVYISGSAMVGMAAPEGECLLMRAASAAGVCYMVPTLSSKPMADIVAAASPGQPSFFQLYVSPDRKRTEALVRRAEQMGFKALFVTVRGYLPERFRCSPQSIHVALLSDPQSPRRALPSHAAGSSASFSLSCGSPLSSWRIRSPPRDVRRSMQHRA